MARLKLSDRLSKNLCNSLVISTDVKEIMDILTNQYGYLIDTIKKLLEHDLYVHITNNNLAPNKIFLEALANILGEFIPPVENTDIKIDCFYTGCALEKIEFHSDDSMFKDKQGKYTIIHLAKEDPLKMPKNGIVKIKDIVDYLSIYDNLLLEQLLTHKLPMLALKPKYISTKNSTEIALDENDEVFVESTILYIENGVYKVCFEPERILYYYWKKKIKQTNSEKKMIKDFLDIANRLKVEIYLNQNDIVIFNNKEVLHNRTECSIELDLNGQIYSREFYIAFAK